LPYAQNIKFRPTGKKPIRKASVFRPALLLIVFHYADGDKSKSFPIAWTM